MTAARINTNNRDFLQTKDVFELKILLQQTAKEFCDQKNGTINEEIRFLSLEICEKQERLAILKEQAGRLNNVVKENKFLSVKDILGIEGLNKTDYNKSWSIAKKIEFILQQGYNEKSTGEIIDIIFKLEPGYLIHFNTTLLKLKKNISATLKQKIDLNQTFYRRLKNENSKTFVYGLKKNETNEVDSPI